MRGAALADLHLGYRRFSPTVDGRNWREVDVESAWFAAIYRILADPPDVVTIAGDSVHHPRVSMYAVKAFRDGLKMLSEHCPVIVAQGNHCAGKTSDVLTPIIIADDYPQVYVVTEPQRIRFTTNAGEKCAVSVFPFVARGDGTPYSLEPDAEADVNILLMHAAVRGSEHGDKLPFFYGAGDQALDVGRESERWDVIACGDYHEFTALHPTRIAFYSGAIERTSSNIWQEDAEKGWVFWEFSEETNTMLFQSIPTRKMSDYDLGDFDLPPGVGAENVNGCLELLAGYPHLDDAMVRFKVDAFPPEERQHIEWDLVQKCKAHCFHFELDLRYGREAIADLGDLRDREGSRLSLEQEWESFFAEDPDDVRTLVAHYLDLGAKAALMEDSDET